MRQLNVCACVLSQISVFHIEVVIEKHVSLKFSNARFKTYNLNAICLLSEVCFESIELLKTPYSLLGPGG